MRESCASTNSLSVSIVCPNCSNALTIARADSTTQYPMGVNRFECRACPYEWVLEKKWYDRTEIKEKEVEEVFGGKDEWQNADSVASKYRMSSSFQMGLTELLL